MYERLAVEDIEHAADVLRPVYDAAGGADGYVSIEVSPYLAMETDATIAEAKRLWREVDRANLMIKVPATKAGLPAIRALTAEGINVNITLLFAQAVYEKVVEAYISGLETLSRNGGDVTRVASVASFFVSRIDSAVDKLLDGKIAKANDPNEGRVSLRSRARLRSPMPSLPTSATSGFSRASVGNNWRPKAQSRSGCSGPAPEPKTKPIVMCSMSKSNRSEHHQHYASRDARRVPRPWQNPRHPTGRHRRRAARAR